MTVESNTILTPLLVKYRLLRFSLINGEVRKFQFAFSPSRLCDRSKYLRHGSDPSDSVMFIKLQKHALIRVKYGYDVTDSVSVPRLQSGN